MSAKDASHAILECHEVLTRLSEYRDGELVERDRRAVEQHIAECERCARFGTAFTRTLEELRRHLLTQPHGGGLRDSIDRVLAAVAREKRS